MKYCPFCNHEIVENRCTNWYPPCDYVGEGITRESIPKGEGLGDITGDPRNNGDYSSQNYD